MLPNPARSFTQSGFLVGLPGRVLVSQRWGVGGAQTAPGGEHTEMSGGEHIPAAE